jgi:RNA polymerase sigma-70 factor (ECF subfamily)
MNEDRTDEMLMLAYRDGDAVSFETLFRRYRGRLYRYLLHQCGNPATADELYQDVWLKVVNARRNYEPTAKFSTWLFRIAHNRLMDHFRRHRRAALESYADDDCALDLPAPESAQPERLLERKALAEMLVTQIGRLPEAQRETFLLAEEGGMTLEEIAAATGVKRETAKSRLRYAVEKLRSWLREAT